MHSFQARRESVQRESVVDRTLKGAPNCKFIYIHWPGQWELLEDGNDWELVPRVRRIKLDPGANGVRWLPKAGNDLAKVDPTQLYLNLERQGCVRIPDDAPICYTGDDGEIYEDPDPGYLWSMPLQDGHKLFIDPWDNPTPRRGGGIDFSGRDVKGFQAWCKLLVAKGIIPPPEAADFVDLVKLQRRRAERHATKANGNPVLQARVEREKGRLQSLLNEQSKYIANAPKRRAPKSKRRGRTRERTE